MAKDKEKESITDKKKAVQAEGFQLNIMRCPEGHKRAGMWTFTVNGQESLYYSQTPDGLQGKITRILEGRPKSAVQLKAVKGKGKKSGEVDLVEDDSPSWDALPTMEERLKAFMTRGKLATKEK